MRVSNRIITPSDFRADGSDSVSYEDACMLEDLTLRISQVRKMITYCMYIYIYIYNVERERDISLYIYIYIYYVLIHVYVYLYT